MKTFFEKIEIETSRRFDFVKLDEKIGEIIKESEIKNGILLLFSFHTTAALVCNENDPTIHRDFVKVFNRLVPEDLGYEHISEGEINARAHQLSMILGNSLALPIREGDLTLGTWQSLFFVELLEPRKRQVSVSILGE